MKKINKRKYRLPVRYVRPYARNVPKKKALDIMYKHYITKLRPGTEENLAKRADEAVRRYPEGPLSWPFNYSNSYLKSGIKSAKRENHHVMLNRMFNKPGWHHPMPGNPNTINWEDDNFWINYNKDVIRDFNDHLEMRDITKGYDNLDWLQRYASFTN